MASKICGLHAKCNRKDDLKAEKRNVQSSIFFFLAVFKILKGSFSLPFPVRKDKYIWEEEIKGIKGNKVKKRNDGSRKRKKKSL